MSFRSKMDCAGFVVLGVLLVTGIYISSTYNSLIQSDQQVRSQWAQVENVYQRRQDLVPNLVVALPGTGRRFSILRQKRPEGTLW